MDQSTKESPRIVESYHAQHSPFGAHASFSLGLVGSPGGFGQSLSKPARQNVYVGYRHLTKEGGAWRLLPFFVPPKSSGVEAFTGTTEVVQGTCKMPQMGPGEYTRHLGWASDTWRADDNRFGFSLLTPFTQVPDPATLKGTTARFYLAPAVFGWIEYDNRQGESDVEIMFGVSDSTRPFRPLEDANRHLKGFAIGTGFGYATKPTKNLRQIQGFDVFDPQFLDHRGLFLLGGDTAFVFTVQAGKKGRLPLVLGFYQEGSVTTGIDCCYAYTRFFKNLEDVLEHGLTEFTRYERIARSRDLELETSRLDADQRFLLAQATHSYYGSSQLLWHAGKPLWVVNEGEYRMINTFDLTIDHLFFELTWHPWAVRNALDLFSRRYSYTDRIKLSGKRSAPGGISFTHDMGNVNHFTMPGRSCYECGGLTGVFSQMTMEQLLNWVICAATYGEMIGDKAWLKRNRQTFLDCAESIRRRDNPNPARRTGIMKHDSDRCGPKGSEITTYDSLDVSLGQARNNLYIAVKTLAAWVLLESTFVSLGLKHEADDARRCADLLASTLEKKWESDTGFFPAVFENNNRSRILPAVEGFAYMLYLGMHETTNRDGRFGRLLNCLGKHISQALQPGICIDSKSGGWKISSTSNNTWFSKIALAQFVVRSMFPEAMNEAAKNGDRVHADWQRLPGCGQDAMCDQINSETGVSCGSRYYPRGVSACLWLLE